MLVGFTAARPLLLPAVTSSGVLQHLHGYSTSHRTLTRGAYALHLASLLYFSQTLSRNTFHGSWGRNELDSQCRGGVNEPNAS
jgi:hypothetical protein